LEKLKIRKVVCCRDGDGIVRERKKEKDLESLVTLLTNIQCSFCLDCRYYESFDRTTELEKASTSRRTYLSDNIHFTESFQGRQ
jgi:hypothetical protein